MEFTLKSFGSRKRKSMIQIGFDIGGTNIKAGAMDDQLNILAENVRPFPRGKNHEVVIDIMKGMVSELLSIAECGYNDISSIGVAVPGTLDTTNEIVIHAYNLGFHNLPLKILLEEKFSDTPVFLMNDANAAALAELRKGTFIGCNTAVLLTLGTGVGGGIILGGKLFNGGLGHGVELGHMRLIHNGPLCSCGNFGCIETVCSAKFFENKGLDVKETIDKAKAGDKQSNEIFTEYLGYLSDAIVSIAMLLDPETVALGGGISEAGDFIFDPLKKLVEAKSFYKFPHNIVPTKLGNKAGFIGAAILGKEK
jgi:glucokinase